MSRSWYSIAFSAVLLQGIAQIFRENVALSLHWKRKCIVVKVTRDSFSVLISVVLFSLVDNPLVNDLFITNYGGKDFSHFLQAERMGNANS